MSITTTPREIAGPRCPGASEKALIIGGHLDSVPNGGWLDGCLDVTGRSRSAAPLRGRVQRPSAGDRPLWWIGPTKKARALAAACWDRRRSPGTSSIEADRGRTDKDGIRLEDAVARCGFPIDRFPEATQRAEERGGLYRVAHRARAGAGAHGVAARRGVGNKRRGAPRHHVLRPGSAFRIDTHGCAPRCAGGRRQTGARNPLHRGQT